MADIVVTYAANTEQLVSGTQAGVDALTDLAGSAQTLAPGLTSTGAALASTGAAAENAAVKLVRLSGSAVTAASGTYKLIDGLRSRNISAAADAFSSLTGVIAGMTGPAGLVTGALSALGGAIAYLAAESQRAASAAKNITGALAWGGVTDIPKEKITALVGVLHGFAGASYEDAGKVVSSFAMMKNGSVPLIDALSHATAEYATITSTEIKPAADALRTAFEEPETRGRAFIETLSALTVSERDRYQLAFEGAAKTNNVYAMQAVMLRALTDQTGKAADGQKELKKASITPTADDVTGEEAEREKANLDEENKALHEQLDLRRQLADRLAAKQPSAPTGDSIEKVRAQSQAIRDDAKKTDAEILSAEVELWQNRVNVGDLRGQELVEAEATLGEKRAELARKTSNDAVAAVRQQIGQTREEHRLGETQMLQIESQMWSSLLVGDKLTATQRTEVWTSFNETMARLHSAGSTTDRTSLKAAAGDARDASEQRIAAAQKEMRALEDVTQAARRGSRERLADAERELAFAKSLGQAGAAMEIEAQRHVTEATNEAAAEQAAIRKNDTSTQIEIAKLKLAAAKSELTAEVEEHKITAAQKVAAERDLMRQLEELQLQELATAQQGLDQESLHYKELANRKLVVAQQLKNQLAALDHEQAQESKKEAEQDAAAWRGAIGEITGAEDSFIRDVLTKRQSLTKSLEQMSAQLVLREIEDDARYYSTKLLYDALGLASDEKTARGGLLAQAVAEMTKTAATRTGVAQRTALENAGQTTWLGQVATRIAQWLGLESSNTAATTAADAERTILDTAASKGSVMAQVAQGFASIEISAAEAAAAAFADSASLGMPGLIAAPGVAAAAYATVLGFASGLGAAAIPSAAGGMVVGGDGLIMAHAEEMVLPAHLSSGIQEMIEGGPAGAGTAGSAGASLSPNFNISAVDAKSVVALFNNPNIMRQIARNLSGYMAMNPSVRGAY